MTQHILNTRHAIRTYRRTTRWKHMRHWYPQTHTETLSILLSIPIYEHVTNTPQTHHKHTTSACQVHTHAQTHLILTDRQTPTDTPMAIYNGTQRNPQYKHEPAAFIRHDLNKLTVGRQCAVMQSGQPADQSLYKSYNDKVNYPL